MRIDIEIPSDAAPGRFGVYVLFDSEGEVLYIGRTKHLGQRLQNHRGTSPWFRHIRALEWTPCDGPTEARLIEKQLISAFRPDANTNDACELLGAKRQRVPDWVAGKLVGLHEDCVRHPRDAAAKSRLDNYIMSLREAGWSLAAIGLPMAMTREGVRLRSLSATGPSVLQAPLSPQRVAARARARAGKRKPGRAPGADVPAPIAAELRRLHVEAKKVRGPTPLDAPSRVASERLTELIADQHLAGIGIHRIALALGVTDLAVRARLARHGYIEPVKGLRQTPYGTPMPAGPKGHCKWGHELAGENVRLVNGDPKRRVCRECESRRAREYRARQDEAAS